MPEKLSTLKLLLVLSDMHGNFFGGLPGQDWPPPGYFDRIVRLDSRELAGILHEQHAGRRHLHFVREGIDRAAEKLASGYPARFAFAAGLSVGGVILWRAIHRGLSVDSLLCFSSTRLRFETKPPPCETYLYFGEQDPHRPDNSWYTTVGLSENLVNNATHEFYRSEAALAIFHRHLCA